jgi:hypothetical protein
MKAQRLLALMIAIFLLSTGVVAGASLWGDYEGYAKAKVYVDDVEKTFSDSDVPALIMHGTTMLPLRTLADSLQALVRWDDSNKTASIYKPNVHMFVVNELIKNKDGTYTMKYPFGRVVHGDKLDFVVFAQVDNLKTNVSSFKISIKTPSGNDAVEPIEQGVTQPSESIWLPWQFSGVKFSEYGKYTVQFSIKLDDGSDYKVVSEKEIISE